MPAFTTPLYLPFLFAVGAAMATMLGGTLALRIKDNRHLILSFSAGALLGVSLLDLLPEAIELSSNGSASSIPVTTVLASGFILYLILSRVVHVHYHSAAEFHSSHHTGDLGAGSLCIHSVLDGVAMGLAFKARPSAGIVVSLAVLAHDFSDGINTVGIVLRSKSGDSSARKWLFLDALSPLVGVLLTLYFSVSKEALGLLLALFSGFFLYIGAVDLLPESHHEHPGFLPICATVLGMLLIYVVVQMGMRF